MIAGKSAAQLGPIGLFAAGVCLGLRCQEIGNSPFENCGQSCVSWERFEKPGLLAGGRNSAAQPAARG